MRLLLLLLSALLAGLLTGCLVSAQPVSATVLSTDGHSDDDFPSLAEAADGTLYAAYVSYRNGADRIRLRRRPPGGDWSTPAPVPVAGASSADVWMPQIALDARERLWVVWSEQVPDAEGEGNWDLYARALHEDAWGPLVRLTDDPRPDIHPHLSRGPDGALVVVWQAHPEGSGDILLRRFDGEAWSEPVSVTAGPESDWYPRAASDPEGTVWVAFDSYRNGNYDVYLVPVREDGTGPLLQVTSSGRYEANASVACTPDGRVWVAWEQGDHLWGKDYGYWLKTRGKNVGSLLGRSRTVRVACYEDGRIRFARSVIPSLPEGEDKYHSSPVLAAGRDGRLWLRVRHRVVDGVQRYLRDLVTHATENGWAPAAEIPQTAGRLAVFARLLPAADGSLWIASSADQRAAPDLHRPVRDRVVLTHLPAPSVPHATPRLRPVGPAEMTDDGPVWDAAKERRDVAAVRAYRVAAGGRLERIVRGDLQRHTDFSWDAGPKRDGSFLDAYRYMIDAAALDFGAVTDHQGGGDYPYWWWLTQKAADLHTIRDRFIALHAYERSAGYPQGHRVVIHPRRGLPIFPFHTKLDLTGEVPGVGSGAVVRNENEMLWRFLRGIGGLAIPHTTGTKMGTDWSGHDPVVEPVVEIYQGARSSYETPGAPRYYSPQLAAKHPLGAGTAPEGMVSEAWARGYRMGVIASSDHASNHISYAMVAVSRLDREGILDGLRRRRTYAATDNIVADFRANDALMGEEAGTDRAPTLHLRVGGTAPVSRVQLLRNGREIHGASPGRTDVELRYTDEDAPAGSSFYHVRIHQEDGEVAWTSPIWIRRGAK